MLGTVDTIANERRNKFCLPVELISTPSSDKEPCHECNGQVDLRDCAWKVRPALLPETFEWCDKRMKSFLMRSENHGFGRHNTNVRAVYFCLFLLMYFPHSAPSSEWFVAYKRC